MLLLNIRSQDSHCKVTRPIYSNGLRSSSFLRLVLHRPTHVKGLLLVLKLPSMSGLWSFLKWEVSTQGIVNCCHFCFRFNPHVLFSKSKSIPCSFRDKDQFSPTNWWLVGSTYLLTGPKRREETRTDPFQFLRSEQYLPCLRGSLNPQSFPFLTRSSSFLYLTTKTDRSFGLFIHLVPCINRRLEWDETLPFP